LRKSTKWLAKKKINRDLDKEIWTWSTEITFDFRDSETYGHDCAQGEKPERTLVMVNSSLNVK
jgi:hypothetical protein